MSLLCSRIGMNLIDSKAHRYQITSKDGAARHMADWLLGPTGENVGVISKQLRARKIFLMSHAESKPPVPASAGMTFFMSESRDIKEAARRAEHTVMWIATARGDASHAGIWNTGRS
jgi:hypothetical protein